jgi:hypothetical protein
MAKERVFIGSSQKNVRVARLIRDRLEVDPSTTVRIWDEGVFGVGEGILERLVAEVDKYDFAVLVWGEDDITESRGESRASPRDNVIFECGLFMGAIGRDRIFIVGDSSVDLKIPSDLAGILLADYDGRRVVEDGVSAVGRACDQISERIMNRLRPYQRFVGKWRSRYSQMASLDHREIIDEVEIESLRDAIRFTSVLNAKSEAYTAIGRVRHKNQIAGTWEHKVGGDSSDGLFMLIVTPLTDIMYGYCTAQNEFGTTLFQTWVLAKVDNANENEINERLSRGDKALRELTAALPPLELQPNRNS